MQNITQKKVGVRSREKSISNMMDRESFTITHSDLFKTMIFLRAHVQVTKIRGEMMSNPSISVPIWVKRSLWSSNKSLYIWGGLSSISIIKAMIAMQGIMTRFGTYLANRSVGIKISTASTSSTMRIFLKCIGRTTTILTRVGVATTTATTSRRGFVGKVSNSHREINIWLILY